MIEFTSPFYDRQELDCLQDAMLNRADYLSQATGMLKKKLSCGEVFLTPNASCAMELMLLAAGIEKGSEVLMPSFNFPSAANAAIRLGLKPVFVDICLDTLVMDYDELCRKVSSHSSCIIPVHYGGATMDMDRLMRFAAARHLLVIEDAALADGGTYRGKALGTIGHAGVYSFHETKNLSCEEGGALVLNYASATLAKAAEYAYANGTNRSEFTHGKTEYYAWMSAGMNAGMSNMAAAVLYAQLIKAEAILEKRAKIAAIYREQLSDAARRHGIALPAVPEENTDNAHVFYLRFPSLNERERMRTALLEKNIATHTHYRPLHTSPMGKQLGWSEAELPNTKTASETVLRLPLHSCMRQNEAEQVAQAVRELL